MKIKEFNKKRKKEKPTQILQEYANNEIYLTDKQLQTILQMKDDNELGVSCQKGVKYGTKNL